MTRYLLILFIALGELLFLLPGTLSNLGWVWALAVYTIIASCTLAILQALGAHKYFKETYKTNKITGRSQLTGLLVGCIILVCGWPITGTLFIASWIIAVQMFLAVKEDNER